MESYLRPKAKGLRELTSNVKKEDIGKVFTIPSPVTGEPLNCRIVQIPVEEAKKLEEYELNFRSAKDLNEFAVNDIRSGIEETGTNTHPVYISQDGEKQTVLVGLRRTYTVIKYGKFLTAIVFKDLTDEEKKYLAKTSDIYKAPSFCDKAFKVISYKETKLKEDVKITDTELCKLFDVSAGTMSEMMSLKRYTKDFFKLFPSISLIRQKFIRKLNSHKAFLEIDDVAIEQLNKLISDNCPQSTDEEDSEVISNEIEKIIFNYLYDTPSKLNEIIEQKNIFEPGKYSDSISVKSTKKGQVVSFALNSIPEDELEIIKSIISKYEKGAD